MVPGPAGEAGGDSEGRGAEDTVSWAVAVLPSLLVLVVTISRWSDGEALVQLYLLCHPQSSFATSGKSTQDKGLLEVHVLPYEIYTQLNHYYCVKAECVCFSSKCIIVFLAGILSSLFIRRAIAPAPHH